MSLLNLSETEHDLALQCLKFFVHSNYFDEDEFVTRLGVTKTQLSAVISSFPSINDENPEGEGFLALNNCFNELCNGFTLPPEEWRKWFAASRNALCLAYAHWRSIPDLS